jgi:hypothetical protein
VNVASVIKNCTQAASLVKEHDYLGDLVDAAQIVGAKVLAGGLMRRAEPK